MPRKENRIEVGACTTALARLQVPNIGLKMLLGANTGWPDRMFLLGNGAVLFIEFKDPDEGEIAPKQQYMINLLRSMGYDVQIHDNKDAAVQAISAAKVDAARLSKEGG